VLAQGLDERADPAPPDERHDDVDRVARVHLGPDLVAHARFTRGVGEQRRVEQRCQRRLEAADRTVGVPAQDRAHDVGREERRVGVEGDGLGSVGGEFRDEPADDLAAGLGLAVIRLGLDRPGDDAGEVA
jgi:hypothetical protein